jgi:hypothetical protein
LSTPTDRHPSAPFQPVEPDADWAGSRPSGPVRSVEGPIDLAELGRRVRAVEPCAVMVPTRIMARVIRRDRGLRFVGWRSLRRPCYLIRGSTLRSIVEADELAPLGAGPWPELVTLLPRPDPAKLAETPAEHALVDAWSRLFYAAVQRSILARIESGQLDAVTLADRVDRMGRTIFEEARIVLTQEGRLLPPCDDVQVYLEFAALYLTLDRFAPALVPHYFPAAADGEFQRSLFVEDVPDNDLYLTTRPEGAPDPQADPDEEFGDDDLQPPLHTDRYPEPPAGAMLTSSFPRLIGGADAAEQRGNSARSAVLWTRAARLGSSPLDDQARQAALVQTRRLVDRLQAALGFDDAEAGRWWRALPALLDGAARGFWTAEARVLYDVQRVCLDHEREVYKVDLVDWALSFGRKPVRRALPHLREVMVSNHLRGASRRLRAARLDQSERVPLAALLDQALHRAHVSLRSRFRPLLQRALEDNDLVPTNLPEEVARDKLVEELLDKISERGFIAMGDLRDACSRNQLKLPDLSGPGEFFRGDRLLRIDRSLDDSLDGVYRRGEIYLRALQRVSSLAFATDAGRVLTKYVLLPYGGAFVALEGLQHLVGPVLHWIAHIHIHLLTPVSLLVLGTLVMALINLPSVRLKVLRGLRRVGWAVRQAVLGWPARFLRLPWVRDLLGSRAAEIAWNYLIKPALFVAPLVAAEAFLSRLTLADAPIWAVPFLMLRPPPVLTGPRAFLATGGLFGVFSLSLNSRTGRDLQEISAESIARNWRQFFLEVIPGIFFWIIATFHRLLEWVERLLYAVDEWLRFRGGESRTSLWVKATLGVFWFSVAYLVRIYVNLLIEPQINPIKHFPVVTVSHKVILPMSVPITRVMSTALMPFLGLYLSRFVAVSTVLLLPGVFGFMAWELKENWRLYRANRPRSLQPVVVGSHGENVARLLRPGFHSGTLPKLFAKLRRAERKELRGGLGKSARKHEATLHHVEESVRHFVERELIALVRPSRSLGPLGIALGEVHLATNRILIELTAEGVGQGSEGLWLALEVRRGWLFARVVEPGWSTNLTEARRRSLTTVLAGLYKMAGVEVVAEQVRASFGAKAPQFDLIEEGLIVRPSARAAAEALYDLDGAVLTPLAINGLPSMSLPTFEASRLLFSKVEVAWERWVLAWQRDLMGQTPPRFLHGVRLLPLAPIGGKRGPARPRR